MSLKSTFIWAASPTTTRGQPTPLSCDAKGERITYAANKSIFVRSISNPSTSREYTQHTAATTVSRFSPSGFYIASGDVSGVVRVWDCVGEGATKGEYGIIAGRINDIAWDGDSQRIIAVGEGKERMGHCITWDSGNSVGEISGHSSQINCVAIRQQRPLRAATGSDDTSVVFYHGAPFKFNTSIRGSHDRFVFGVGFSPDGATLASVGADRRICLYDGKTGETKGRIGDGVHTGSIFGVAWNKDSRRVVTASADQTVRIWDVEAGKNVQTWRMGEEGVVSIPDQQVGVVWPGGAQSDGLVISVDLDGNLNYLDARSGKPQCVVRGHQKSVTAAVCTGNTLFTGSYEGRVMAWDVPTGTAEKIDGESHTTQVTGFSADPSGDRVYSVGWDDKLRCVSSKTFIGGAQPISSQPKGVAAASNGLVYVATGESLDIFSDGKKVDSMPVKGATCVAASKSFLAVGHDDKSVKVYTLSGTSKPSLAVAEPRRATGAISSLSFSRDGNRLAAGVSNGKILVYDTKGWGVVTDRWSAHTARVTCVGWDETGEWAVSGSLDTNVYVWSVNDPGKRIKALNAHKDGVGAVAWVGKKMVVSSGGDASVKIWSVEGM